MLRPLLAAGIVLAFALSPALAQQENVPQNTPMPETTPKNAPSAGQADPTLVGLPVYSSDGQKLGQVAEVGTSGGRPAVRAELAEFIGIGSISVIIDAEVYQKKADRIEVAMTAEQVKDTISRQRQDQKQQ